MFFSCDRVFRKLSQNITVLPAAKYTFPLKMALKYNRVRVAEGRVTQHRAGLVETQRLLLLGVPGLDPCWLWLVPDLLCVTQADLK